MNFKNCDQVILNSHSWDEFVKNLKAIPEDVDRGDVYERLVQLHMLTDSIYLAQFEKVWHAKLSKGELPSEIRSHLNLPSLDEGIDLIALGKNGEYTSIQAKYRSDRNATFVWRDLSTFTSLSFDICKNISWGIVRTTTIKPIRKKYLVAEPIRFEFLDESIRLDENDGEGWGRIHDQINGEKPKPRKIKRPRCHQLEALKNTKNAFENQNQTRGRIIMPCGTGKSLIGYWLRSVLKAKKIIIAVPSLALLNQTLRVWTEENIARGIDFNYMVVCSDTAAGEVDQDSFTANTKDLKMPSSTNVKKISEFLTWANQDDKPTLLLTTYQSGKVISEAIKKSNNFKFDLAIMDEAHKTVGKKDKLFAHLLWDKNLPAKNRIFMTATERRFKNSRSSNIVSMEDDSEIFGKRIYELSFKEAIEQDIICDYEIATINITSSEIENLWIQNRFIRTIYENLEEAIQPIATSIALEKAFATKNISKTISFHRSITRAKKFQNLQKTVHEALNPETKINFFHVSAAISMPERLVQLRDFDLSDRSLITNARCLTEGVDIPSVDCVLFADPKKSVVDVIQATGRALRPSKNKENSLILVPVIIPENENLESKIKSFDPLIKIVKQLATQDQRIVEIVKVLSEGKKPSDGPIIDFWPEELDTIDLDLKTIEKNVHLEMWNHIGQLNYIHFNDARDIARKLKLTSVDEWNEWARSSQRPPNIPITPHQVYQDKGWKGWPNFLGYHSLKSKFMPPMNFNSLREYARSLGLRGDTEWRQWYKIQKPPNIPADPSRVYKDKGWKDWGDFLGTGNVSNIQKSSNYTDFNSAREYARSLGLTGYRARGNNWKKFIKSGDLPSDIPRKPDRVYKDEGWKDWSDFLNSPIGVSGKINIWEFSYARSYIRKLKLTSLDEWEIFSKSDKRPIQIPSRPDASYQGKGWKGYPDFLGYIDLRSPFSVPRDFNSAREYARSLKLTSQQGKKNSWKKFIKSGDLPSDIPVHPDRVYKDKGWKDWGDFLGYSK